LVHVVGGVAKQALLGPDLTPGAFSALSATSPTDLWAVSSGHLYRSDGLTWRASTGPSGLLALAATSPTDVWGIASSGLTDQIMHFDGAIWSIAAGGIDLGSGATISARGADEVWIAGRELAHYQAKTWTHASRPSPTALPLSVFAAPGGATWVVGQAGLVAHGVGASLALDTKGPHWANTTGPYAGSYGGASRATTLFGSSASDLWVGGERVLHYDGAAWTDSGLVGGPWAAGFARAPNDAWLVNGDRGDVRHYDGAAWSYVGSVLPFGGQAMPPGDAIWASGPSDVWVADKGRNGQSGTFNHWNGSSWSTVTQGDCAFDFPRTVWGSGPDDVWFGSTRMVHVTNGGTTCTAFDVAAPSQVTFKSVSGRGPKDVYTTDGDSVYHYDGASWTQLPPTPEGGLRQVRSAGPTDLWALGAHGAFRFDGSAWTAVPGLETMTDLYGASSKDVWLAGPGGRVLRYTP
jgi:hypothetical protein